MVQTTTFALYNQIYKKYNYSISRFVRTAVLFLTLSINLTLFSCSQPDSIAPTTTQPTAGAREAATVLNVDHFDQSRQASFWAPELHANNAGTTVAEQRRVGAKSMRFAWKPSQYDGTNRSCHAEIGTAPLAKTDNERWYGFSMYLPKATMANDKQTACIMQWAMLPDAGTEGTVPSVGIGLNNNVLEFYYRASNKPIEKFLQAPTSQKIMYNLGYARYDQWVDYVVHIKWDATGKTGIVQVWQGGKLTIDEQNISVGYVSARNFWKMGLYCYTGKSDHSQRTIYYDEARIGGPSATYNDVKVQ